MTAPVTRRLLDAVIPPTARWLVARMRRLEEAHLSAEARWELLRRHLEQLGRRG